MCPDEFRDLSEALVGSGAEPHTPVMLDEVLEWLGVKPDGTYIDATLGAGGHSAAIASRLTSGTLISLDQDEQALALAVERLKSFGTTVKLVESSFSRIAEVVHGLEIPGDLDGVLADLGSFRACSLIRPARGVSRLREAGPLDMRMAAGDELTGRRDCESLVGERNSADIALSR